MTETKDTPENIQCPVCGYYCLGKGGVGCIDKPSMFQPTPEPSVTTDPLVDLERAELAVWMNGYTTLKPVFFENHVRVAFAKERQQHRDALAEARAEAERLLKGYVHGSKAENPWRMSRWLLDRAEAAETTVAAQAQEIADLRAEHARLTAAFTSRVNYIQELEALHAQVRSRLTAVEQERATVVTRLQSIVRQVEEALGPDTRLVRSCEQMIAALTPTSPQTPEDRT